MSEHLRKPDWLKIRLGGNEQFTRTKSIVESHCLHTICTSGKSPNMGECWSRGTATFMIAGDICTRSCRFCNTLTGKPLPLDPKEPANVAESIRLMNLKHAVITSVDRDDLPDLGAQHWVDTIRTIKAVNPETTVEVLIPDFQGRLELVDKVVAAAPEIISHNMETVRRISPEVRSAAKYEVSLSVLARIAAQGVVAKTAASIPARLRMFSFTQTPPQRVTSVYVVVVSNCLPFSLLHVSLMQRPCSSYQCFSVMPDSPFTQVAVRAASSYIHRLT